MDSLQKEELSVERGLKISLKTLIDCFIVIMLLMCSIFVLSPKLSLKIHETIGNKKIQELNYKMIYSK